MPLNVSRPRKRKLMPPGTVPSRDSERTGNREVAWRSPSTLEAQNTNPNPLAANFTNFTLNAPQPPLPRPLWAPGRGKASGSKRVLSIGLNKNGR